jgi:hypothetical protein
MGNGLPRDQIEKLITAHAAALQQNRELAKLVDELRPIVAKLRQNLTEIAALANST